jgi:ribose 5-phosphate isomerase RpiB
LRTNGVTDKSLDEIVREVLAAIQSRGLGAALAAPQAKVEANPAPQTRVRPGAATPQAQPKARPAKCRPAEAPRKVFLTADMLLQRLADNDGQSRTIELAHNEFLTPAAMDLADQRHLAVRKQPKPLVSPAGAAQAAACPPTTAQAACPPTTAGPAEPQAGDASGATQVSAGFAALGLVVGKPNELVRGVLDSLERDKIIPVDFNRTDCWIVNTQMLCEAVVSGGLAGGVVMVPQAADAVILANKVRGIRAVQGASPGSLALAMARLAPNVLVLEHSSATFHEIRTMLRMFAAGQTSKGQADAVISAIEKLERA